MKKKVHNVGFISRLNNYRGWIILFLIFALEVFLRFYQIDTRNGFGWDQVDNAWAAKKIIVDHNFPLLGMVARGNSGIYIGPAYYYLISIFYWFTNLDPIASGIFAGLTSIFTFFTIFFVIKKLFSFNMALIAVFINTISFFAIMFDRTQWPVDFIPAVSLIIFYCLYQILLCKPRYLIFLAIALGFSFHIHFTSIFYPIIILLSLPFFPRTKETFKYIFLSLPLFLVWLVPIVIYDFQSGGANGGSLLRYTNTYYLGFHLRRVMQLTGDAFIQFEHYFLFEKLLKPLKFVLPVLFALIYLFKNRLKEKFLMIYLILLWFLVPWLVFSTYGGEISDYYFSINRFIVLIILSYLITRVFQINNLIPKIFVFSFFAFYAFVNMSRFLNQSAVGISFYKTQTLKDIGKKKVIKFSEGVPKSYFYYIYTRKIKK